MKLNIIKTMKMRNKSLIITDLKSLPTYFISGINVEDELGNVYQVTSVGTRNPKFAFFELNKILVGKELFTELD